MKILAIVQARQNSKRLPNKVLLKIQGLSIVEIIYKRLCNSKLLDDIIFAIPSKDNELKNFLLNKNIKVFCGSENNVTQRFFNCAKKFNGKIIVRITADCPFVDSKMLDEMLEVFINSKIDFMSNGLKPSFPDGFDIEIFTFNALKKAFYGNKTLREREHVTFFITNRKNKFKLLNFSKRNYLNLSNIRLTLDNEFDFEVIKNVFKEFNYNYLINYDKIFKLVEKKPQIFLFNKHFKRNYGMNKVNKKYSFANSIKIIPSGNQMISKNPFYILPFQWPMYYKKAKGIEILTVDNKKYYDFSLMGVGCNLLGYANSRVDNFIKKKISLGSSSTLNSYEEYDLAQELININPWAKMVRFAKTGGEINSIAIRIARAASGKNKVAFCGYHGWHDWYLSANLSNNKNLNNHLMKGFYTLGVPKNLINTSFPFEFNNINSLKKILSIHKDVGVIKIEVFRNYPPDLNFLRELRSICNKQKIILIFDECTSAFRNNYGGVYENYGIEPDIVLYGKALGNGYPITACVGKEEVMNFAKKSFISSTFWTERIGFSAALATLKEMKRLKSWVYVNENGIFFKKNLEKIAKNNKINIEITGLPAITSYYIKDKNCDLFHAYITQEMLKIGYLATQTLYMSISHDKKKIDLYLNKLNDIFEFISKNLNNKNFANFLNGPLPNKPFRRMN